jgi:hypothetical protein
MSDEASVDVLVHDLINLPALATVDSIYQALRRFHSLNGLLDILVSYLVLSLNNMYEFEIFLCHHLMHLFWFLSLIFALLLLDARAQKHVVKSLVYEVYLELTVAHLGIVVVRLGLVVQDNPVWHLVQNVSLLE